MDQSMPSARRLKILGRAAAGLLTISLFGCSSIKAPNTLFITYSAPKRSFKKTQTSVEGLLDKYAKPFERSNPETRIVYITYPSSEILEQISKDTDLNLGPDLIAVDMFVAFEYMSRDLTVTLPDKKYFQSIYGTAYDWATNADGEYIFAPWIRDPQVACYNNTRIKKPPSTIQELEKLSASGYKIGLSSDPGELLWTAGANNAFEELNAVGKQMKTDQSYPAIKKWLEWLRKAALYQNILFFENMESLQEHLTSNKLDWIPCMSLGLEELKNKMGKTLSVAPLPNGPESKAAPIVPTYGFALGKNSSQSQRKLALKYIKTLVNTIAQRKLELDDEEGLIAVNQNVKIPPESSKTLNTLGTAIEQTEYYDKEWAGVISWMLLLTPNRQEQLTNTFIEFTNGYLSINEAFKIITNAKNN